MRALFQHVMNIPLDQPLDGAQVPEEAEVVQPIAKPEEPPINSAEEAQE